MGIVLEVGPDKLSYIVESGGKEMLRSCGTPEKPSPEGDEGQISGRRGVSPSSTLDLEQLPLVPLQRSV